MDEIKRRIQFYLDEYESEEEFGKIPTDEEREQNSTNETILFYGIDTDQLISNL